MHDDGLGIKARKTFRNGRGHHHEPRETCAGKILDGTYDPGD